MQFLILIAQLIAIVAQFVEANVDTIAWIKVVYPEEQFYLNFEGPLRPDWNAESPCSAGQTVDVISESFLELIDKVDELYGDGAKIYAPEVQYTNGAWEFGEAPLVGTVSRIICCFFVKNLRPMLKMILPLKCGPLMNQLPGSYQALIFSTVRAMEHPSCSP